MCNRNGHQKAPPVGVMHDMSQPKKVEMNRKVCTEVENAVVIMQRL